MTCTLPEEAILNFTLWISHCKTVNCRAGNIAHYLRAALSDVQTIRRGCVDRGEAAIRTGWRQLAAVDARS